MNLNAILGMSFLIVGCAATFLMYHLWGYPYDAKRHVSSAPRSLTAVHRLLGLTFVAIYLVMLVRMLPRLWAFEGELPMRSVLHVGLGFLIGALLIVKVYIIRFARHMGNALPYLGTGVLLCSFVMLAMPLTLSAREWWIGRAAQRPAAQERASAALRAAPDFFANASANADAGAWIDSGHALLHGRCLQCHDVRRIIQFRRAAEEWIGLVQRMSVYSQERTPIAAGEAEFIALYLIAALGQDAPLSTPPAPPPPAPSRAPAALPAAAEAGDDVPAPNVMGREELPDAPAPDGPARDALPSATLPAPPSTGASPPPAAPAPAESPGATGGASFAQVQDIFETHCIMCHKGSRAPKGLQLHAAEPIFAARPGRPAAVVPGDAEASEIHRRITGVSTPRMPMTGPPWLSDEEIETIRAWIEAGAKTDAAPPQPREAETAAPAPAQDRPDAAPTVEPSSPPAAQPAASPPSSPRAAPPKPALEDVTFADVRPVLAMNCVRCHSAQGIMGGPPEGLILSNLDSILRSAERPVLIPGNAEASLLLRHIRGLEEPRMPFDGPPWLSDDEVALITRWIREGARNETGERAPVPVGREVRFEGTLTARWAVDGIPFRVTRGTDVRDSPQIGDRVEVRAIIREDGSLEAERVRER